MAIIPRSNDGINESQQPSDFGSVRVCHCSVQHPNPYVGLLFTGCLAVNATDQHGNPQQNARFFDQEYVKNICVSKKGGQAIQGQVYACFGYVSRRGERTDPTVLIDGNGRRVVQRPDDKLPCWEIICPHTTCLNWTFDTFKGWSFVELPISQ